MQLIINFNKGIYFLLCVIDFFSGHTYVIPLKVKKGITITNAFQKVLDESNRKANKICVDKGSEFYNRLMKPWYRNVNLIKENLLLLKDLIEP